MKATELPSLKNAPNTLREYETIYILRPTTVNDQVAEVNSKVKTIIESAGGKVLGVDNWGKRRLAYEIQKERRGIYLYWRYLGDKTVVREFERNMKLSDAVIRYMTTKIDEDVDPNAKPTDVTEETFESAANTAADEEDLYLTRSKDADTGNAEGNDDDDSDTYNKAHSNEPKVSTEKVAASAAEQVKVDTTEKAEDSTSEPSDKDSE